MMSSQLLTVVPKLAERLGDNHDNVRGAARRALLSSLDALGAAEFFRLVLPALSSRKPLVKEGVRPPPPSDRPLTLDDDRCARAHRRSIAT